MYICTKIQMIRIEKKLLDEISSYCKLNNIKDMSIFATNLLRKAFIIEKFGEKPPFFEKKEDDNEVKETNVIEVTPEPVSEIPVSETRIVETETEQLDKVEEVVKKQEVKPIKKTRILK